MLTPSNSPGQTSATQLVQTHKSLLGSVIIETGISHFQFLSRLGVSLSFGIVKVPGYFEPKDPMFFKSGQQPFDFSWPGSGKTEIIFASLSEAKSISVFLVVSFQLFCQRMPNKCGW